MTRASNFYSRLAVSLAGLLTLAIAGVVKAEDTLKVATLAGIPFSMPDDKGHLTGFDVEIARALCSAIQARCEIVSLPFPSVLSALDHGTIDFAVAGMLRTPEREKKYLFSERYWRSSSSYVGKSGQWPISTVPNLIGKRIAVMHNAVQDVYVSRQVPAEATVVRFVNHEAGLRGVAEGQADIALAPTIFVLQFLLSKGGQNLETVGDPVTEAGLGGDVAMALPRGREELRDRVNQALHVILADGRYDAISSRFLPFRLY